jgi:5-methylcytosine-specific restriction endonuclease McrA
MTPHKILPWQSAVTLVVLGKVDVLESYDDTITSPSLSLPTPAVVRLKRALSGTKRGIKFSRINVFTRDEFRCQYCGARKPMRELNYDHVIPRVRGGQTVWENIVTSCYACNDKKGHKSLEQAGMKLLRRPYKPRTLPMSFLPLDMARVPEPWIGYCELGAAVDDGAHGRMFVPA